MFKLFLCLYISFFLSFDLLLENQDLFSAAHNISSPTHDSLSFSNTENLSIASKDKNEKCSDPNNCKECHDCHSGHCTFILNMNTPLMPVIYVKKYYPKQEKFLSKNFYSFFRPPKRA